MSAEDLVEKQKRLVAILHSMDFNVRIIPEINTAEFSGIQCMWERLDLSLAVPRIVLSLLQTWFAMQKEDRPYRQAERMAAALETINKTPRSMSDAELAKLKESLVHELRPYVACVMMEEATTEKVQRRCPLHYGIGFYQSE